MQLHHHFGTISITRTRHLRGARKKASAVVLLGFLGFVVAIAYGMLFPSYHLNGFYVSAGLLLPADSPFKASDLMLMTRDEHPGVRIVAYDDLHIGFFAAGNLGNAETAVHLAVREVIAANDGEAERTWDALVFRRPPARNGLSGDGLKGFLAGLGIALGSFIPPRSRSPIHGIRPSRTSA
jgi:hypothetical protein